MIIEGIRVTLTRFELKLWQDAYLGCARKRVGGEDPSEWFVNCAYAVLDYRSERLPDDDSPVPGVPDHQQWGARLLRHDARMAKVIDGMRRHAAEMDAAESMKP